MSAFVASQVKVKLLGLPTPVIQRVLVTAGSGGAAAAMSCSALSKLWDDALACPSLLARFLLARHGTFTALLHIYSDSSHKVLLKPCRSPEEQDALLGTVVDELLQAGALIQPQVRLLHVFAVDTVIATA